MHLGIDLLQLIVQLRQLGIGGAELGTQVGRLNLEVGLLGAQSLEQLRSDLRALSGIFQTAGAGGDRIRIAGLYQTVKSFLVHALAFGDGELLC